MSGTSVHESEVETVSEAQSSSSGNTRYTTASHRHGPLRKDKVSRKLVKGLEQRHPGVKAHRAIHGNLIKTFWSCKFVDSLPAELRPRVRAPSGKRIDFKRQDAKRLAPHKWTNNMAHAKLCAQVKRRQREGTHTEYYAREVLPSDMEAVVKDVKHLKAVGQYPPKPKPTPDNKKKHTGDIQLAEGQWQEVHLKALMKAPGQDEGEPDEDDGPWQRSSTSSERKAAIASELEYLDRKASDVDEQTDNSSHQSIESKLQDREQQDEESVEGKASLQESPMTKKRKTIVLAHKHSSKRGKGYSGSGK
ncbi:hypothetical protein LTR27_006579 [Elasticomyces elasticus]|nr:hypothetical protein LTR27_006579 [Elasticomyces elasticus]